MDPEILLKSYSANVALVEEDAGDPPGTFEAVVSVFGNEDSMGDVVERGAFARSLGEWAERGRPIPVVWAHQFHDAEAFLGRYVAAEETETGLKLKGQLDLDHPRAARVYELMKRGDIAEFSFSGIVRDAEPIEKEDPEDSWGFGPLRIKDVDLWEAGPCFKGANPATQLLGIKSRGDQPAGRHRADAEAVVAKEGRVLAQKHVDALKTARQQLDDVIVAVEKADTSVEETAPTPDASKAAGQTSTEPPALDPKTRARLVLSTLI